MPQRDLFANFARMRREMDQLLGDAWERAGYASRRAAGFSPRVDVYYCGDPAKAVVKIELPGMDRDSVNIEISGRRLVVSGERPVQETEGRVYQQLEIASGPFRRIVELSAEVDADSARATYERGVLRVEISLMPPDRARHTVPIEGAGTSEE